MARNHEACVDVKAALTCSRFPQSFMIGDSASLIYRKTLQQFVSAGLSPPINIKPISDQQMVSQVPPGHGAYQESQSKFARAGLGSSHAAAWIEIVERGLDGGVVFEDDIIFHENFCSLLPEYWRELPCDPALVYLGATHRTHLNEKRVHIGSEKSAVPPWDTHAYYISYNQAERMLRRYAYHMMRMNITAIGWKVLPLLPADPGWDAEIADYKKLRPEVAHGYLLNADFFFMNQFNYFSSSEDRKHWAWFDSTSTVPAKVGEYTFFNDPTYMKPLRVHTFGVIDNETIIRADDAGDSSVVFGGSSPSRVNPYGVHCRDNVHETYRPLVRGTGLVYQALIFPCTSKLNYALPEGRLVREAHKMRRYIGLLVCELDIVGLSGGYCLSGDWPGKQHMPADRGLAAGIGAIARGGSLLDLGAGAGQYGHYFNTEGRRFNVQWSGFDGAENIETFTLSAQIRQDPAIPFVQSADLTAAIEHPTRHQADWVMSLEVAEHLPPAGTEAFITNLHQLNLKGVILSWAIATPWQPGHRHINNRDNHEVVKLFQELGYYYDQETALTLRRQATYGWFNYSLMVFRRVVARQREANPRETQRGVSKARALKDLRTYCTRANALPKNLKDQFVKRFQKRCASLPKVSESTKAPISSIAPAVTRAIATSFSPANCTSKACLAGQTAVETATHCCPHGPSLDGRTVHCSHAFCDVRLPTYVSWCKRVKDAECESGKFTSASSVAHFPVNDGILKPTKLPTKWWSWFG